MAVLQDWGASGSRLAGGACALGRAPLTTLRDAAAEAPWLSESNPHAPPAGPRDPGGRQGFRRGHSAGGSLGRPWVRAARFVTVPVRRSNSIHRAGACDGFNVHVGFQPEGLSRFVDHVVPELQRRGLFRTAYPGTTLRDVVGLKRPDNQFFLRQAPAPAPALVAE